MSLQKADADKREEDVAKGLLKWRGTVFHADGSDVDDEECDGRDKQFAPMSSLSSSPPMTVAGVSNEVRSTVGWPQFLIFIHQR